MFGAQGAPGIVMNGPPRVATYNGSSTLVKGMAVCYDVTQSTADLQNTFVTDPTFNNMHRPAGVVLNVGTTDPVTGYEEVTILPVADGVAYNVEVLTDQNIAAGDVLGVVPGSLYWGKAVCGRGLFLATEAVNGSSTPALIQGDFGWNAVDPAFERTKIMRFFDDFLGERGLGTTADLGGWLSTLGTGGSATFDDDAIGGICELLAATSGFRANLTLNGEPFKADKDLFFRCRVNISNVTASEGVAIIGVGLTDTSWNGGVPTDYIIFDFASGGVVTCKYVKDGATGLVTVTGTTVAADTWVDLAFLVKWRGSTPELHIWIDGTKLTHSATTTEIVDNENLTIVAESFSATNPSTFRIDRVECNNART